MIRTLKENEIECRVQSVKKNGCILLIYKDARVDMNILDEVYGIDGWQRTHEVINSNLFCNVEIWSKEKQQWIKKQDVGVESNTEKQKGEASDSFKRACFNLGIGRELYTAPFTWISLSESEIECYKDKNNKDAFKLKFGLSFSVKEIGYNEYREINKLIICDNKGKERFKYTEGKIQYQSTHQEVKSDAEKKLLNCKSLEELKTVFSSLSNEDAIKYQILKDELKFNLNGK
jgi:hypothetical protein